MSRLPQVGGDDGNWGQVLNDFLAQEHNSDGSLKIRTNGTLDAKYTKPAGGIPEGDLASEVQTKINAVETVSEETSRALAAEANLDAAITATTSLINDYSQGVLFRNGNGTWPSRPTTHARFTWVGPGQDKGVYANSTAYVSDDIVTYSGGVYQRINNGTPVAWNAGEWRQIAMSTYDTLELA